MSCPDVMYQPYSPYFPYHQRAQVAVSAGPVGPLTPVPSQAAPDYRKFSVVKSHADPSPASLDGTPSVSPDQCRPVAASSSAAVLRSNSCGDEKDKAEAQYLSANCVLFTYYSGDISAVIDEHFARALSQATSYTAPEATTAKGGQSKDGPPMSHRNFPPSFWNSNYTPISSSSTMMPGTLSSLPPEITYTDPYHHGTLLHHQNDPWHHYTLTGQASHFGHHSSYHPGMSSVPGASRFTPQYGSLLLQPSVRSAARLGSAAACASLEKSEAWASSRYHDPIGMESNYGAYGAMTPMTDSSNTGYTSMYGLYKLQCIPRPYR